jgi:rubrerythrin
MTIDFNADEIFEMAEQIERNGARFYRRAAEGESEPGDRAMLLELAAMEDAHEKTFASMREDLSALEDLAKTYDPHGEAVSYLRAMADGHVFDVKADPTEFLNNQRSTVDILQKAIGFEKNSIVFYLGMREMVPKRLGKDNIDRIIREEMRHIVLLSRELAAHTRLLSNRHG